MLSSAPLQNLSIYRASSFSSSNGSLFFVVFDSGNLGRLHGSSVFWGKSLNLANNNGGCYEVINGGEKPRFAKRRISRGVFAMSNSSSFKMNLNEYMVTLEKPLGIRFAVSVDGSVVVYSLKKGGNAEKSRIIMIGDVLKKANNGSGGGFVEIKDVGDTEKLLNQKNGTFSLVLERPSSPFPIQQLHAMSDLDVLFNKGRVPLATWSKTMLAANLQTSSEGCGNAGFAIFSPKFLNSQGWKHLSHPSVSIYPRMQNVVFGSSINQLVSILSEEECGGDEWGHGSFPLEEYIKALDRSKGELVYNHSLGMQYNKITDQIYVGSCVQTESDVQTLANIVGITAVLNFQSANECTNWGIDSDSINDYCRRSNILMINYPIREVDPFDLRKKLPFCAGLLLRLLRKKHRVYVTCTTGLERSPACIISYLHWMQDTSLHDACNFVMGLHPCRPNRAAIVWATWDLIAMVESGRHDGPPTHAVTFVWNGREGEEVFLVGDFTGNWKEPLRALHKGGSKYGVDVKLPQGKYRYKFIINGQWRHSTSSPAESDEHGNINNVIILGNKASVRPSFQQQTKDSAVVRVIERPLTENERVMLAKAARCVTFSICPVRLAPK